MVGPGGNAPARLADQDAAAAAVRTADPEERRLGAVRRWHELLRQDALIGLAQLACPPVRVDLPAGV